MNKILLVDDEPIIVMLFKTILESKGYAVSVALTGEEGLKMAKEINPDLIILDYHLPGLNGKEVYYKLKQNPKTKILQHDQRNAEIKINSALSKIRCFIIRILV